MSNTNQWEKQLESWIPRPPSAKLKEKLFPTQTSASSRVAEFSIWSSLVPSACACLLATCAWISSVAAGGHLQLMPANTNILASLSFPDRNLLPCLAAESRCQEWNVITANTFYWTKPHGSLSITDSFPTGKTNIQKL